MFLLLLRCTLALATFVVVASSYAITGALGGVDAATGQRPVRHDFTSFQHAGPAFDLYILALQDFAQQDQALLLSYYQVAGWRFLCLNLWDSLLKHPRHPRFV